MSYPFREEAAQAIALALYHVADALVDEEGDFPEDVDEKAFQVAAEWWNGFHAMMSGGGGYLALTALRARLWDLEGELWAMTDENAEPIVPDYYRHHSKEEDAQAYGSHLMRRIHNVAGRLEVLSVFLNYFEAYGILTTWGGLCQVCGLDPAQDREEIRNLLHSQLLRKSSAGWGDLDATARTGPTVSLGSRTSRSEDGDTTKRSPPPIASAHALSALTVLREKGATPTKYSQIEAWVDLSPSVEQAGERPGHAVVKGAKRALVVLGESPSPRRLMTLLTQHEQALREAAGAAHTETV